MDIVERLRELGFIYHPNEAGDIALEAADEIERLRKELIKSHQQSVKTINDLVIQRQDMANEIERLREAAKDRPKDRPNDAADKIERLREEIADLKYIKTYLERAYMAARKTLDSKGIHMDYFLSRVDYDAALKEDE